MIVEKGLERETETQRETERDRERQRERVLLLGLNLLGNHLWALSINRMSIRKVFFEKSIRKRNFYT